MSTYRLRWWQTPYFVQLHPHCSTWGETHQMSFSGRSKPLFWFTISLSIRWITGYPACYSKRCWIIRIGRCDYVQWLLPHSQNALERLLRRSSSPCESFKKAILNFEDSLILFLISDTRSFLQTTICNNSQNIKNYAFKNFTRRLQASCRHCCLHTYWDWHAEAGAPNHPSTADTDAWCRRVGESVHSRWQYCRILYTKSYERRLATHWGYEHLPHGMFKSLNYNVM